MRFALEEERQDARLRDAARVLHDAPALDAFSTEAATLCDDILARVAVPALAITARDWRAVQEQATRLLALARLVEAYTARG